MTRAQRPRRPRSPVPTHGPRAATPPVGRRATGRSGFRVSDLRLPTVRLPAPTGLPRFTPGRAGALLGILASLGGIYGLAVTSAFTYATADIPELTWTTRADVAAAIGIPEGTNLFRLTVDPLEARIRALPGVASATVVVSLPDTLVVEVREREAILAWGVGDVRYLVDREGVIFATAEPGAVATAGLPVVDDSREAAGSLVVGDILDPVDLDAATRLASLVPSDIGSTADRLLVTISDATGYVVGTSPATWIAIFGGYTPTVRPPTIIPEQVRTLRSLLAGRESTVAQVILSDPDHGTFIPKPAPTAVP